MTVTEHTTEAQTLEIVCATLARLPGVRTRALRPECLLLDEVGLDSLQFVDLTVGLERALRVARFPMQQWVDECFELDRPLTVGALAVACQAVLDEH